MLPFPSTKKKEEQKIQAKAISNPRKKYVQKVKQQLKNNSNKN